MVRISLVCWLSLYTCTSFIRSKFRSVFFVPLSLDHFGFLYWKESLIARAPYCASWILMVHPAVLSDTAAFSCLITSEWKASFTISTTKPKSDGSNGISTSNIFQFQSISKPSEAAAWCGKPPHHSNSCGSGIHFWMMPSQNLEVAWGRVSTHIWRKRWNKSIGKSMAVLMKHFLYYTVHISTTNSPTIFHHFWPHCYSLPTFQVGPWPGRGASVRCFTSTTWTPLLSST